MRELTQHNTNPANTELKVEVLDEPGAGNASHLYCITGMDSVTNPSTLRGMKFDQIAQHVLFQNGSPQEYGVNGVTHEAHLAILIDRLECFQAGPFAHPANAKALQHLYGALEALQSRTQERMAQGIEGTHEIGTSNVAESETASREDLLENALKWTHIYIDASDRELTEDYNMTRDDALTIARNKRARVLDDQ